MHVFDCVEPQMKQVHGGDGAILLYDLLTCLYLCLKIDRQILGCSFFEFLFKVTSLTSFVALAKHVAPASAELGWTEDLYSLIEYEVLSVLRFKTEFVSPSQVAFELVSSLASS